MVIICLKIGKYQKGLNRRNRFEKVQKALDDCRSGATPSDEQMDRILETYNQVSDWT